MIVGRSWRGMFDAVRSVAMGSIQRVRQIPNNPLRVMYAAMPRNVKTTSRT